MVALIETLLTEIPLPRGTIHLYKQEDYIDSYTDEVRALKQTKRTHCYLFMAV